MATSPALRLLEPCLTPLPAALPPGRLIELSGTRGACARTTTAVDILRHAQREGETAVWIQPEDGPLYPPDLHDSGIDIDALIVVHVPRGTSSRPSPVKSREARRATTGHRLCRAAELLLRSGAFGLVIIDMCEEPPPPGTEAWQGRLLGLARQHESRVVLLTDKPSHADSLGTLVGLRIEPRRERTRSGQFRVTHEVLKNKSGAPFDVADDHHRGPWGLG